MAEEGREKWRSGRKIRAIAKDFSGTASVKRIRNAQVACSSHVSSSTLNRIVKPFGLQGGFCRIPYLFLVGICILSGLLIFTVKQSKTTAMKKCKQFAEFPIDKFRIL